MEVGERAAAARKIPRPLEIAEHVLVGRGANHSVARVRKNTLGLWLVFVCCAATAVAALDPRSIPDPRPAGWVVDQAHQLAAEDIATIDRLGDAVRATGGNAGLFVVTVETTGGANHRRFATDLLNRWGPNRSLRSGVLVLLAVKDRKAELVLGDDHLAGAGRAKSDAIMRDQIVARMKQGDPRGALLGGARACAAQFFGVSLPAGGATTGVSEGNAASSAATAFSAPAVAEPELERPDAPAPPAAAPMPKPAPAAPRSRTAETHPTLSLFVGLLMLLVPLGGLVAAIVIVVRVCSGPRKCRGCAREMQKLDPSAEAAHLAPGERTEEKLGSVNYDVWLCGGCGAVEKIRHGKWFTSYSRCPQCAAVTRNEVSRTVSAATRFSTGLAEITEHCAHCGFHHVSMRVLARLPEPSHTRSSGGGSRSSGRSSSGGGSSGSW